jgi:hypothetical protein
MAADTPFSRQPSVARQLLAGPQAALPEVGRSVNGRRERKEVALHVERVHFEICDGGTTVKHAILEGELEDVPC